MLFINSIKKTRNTLLSIISNRSIMKKRNRIDNIKDNIKDSYKIFISTYNYLNSLLINLIIII